MAEDGRKGLGKRDRNPASAHAVKQKKTIRRGLTIYQTGASPYWYARWYHPVEKRYVVKSTKETSRVEARQAAEELVASHVARIPKIERQHTFEYYAKRLDDQNARSGMPNVANIDRTTLFNKDKGLVKAFGKKDIRTITALDIKDYFLSLDDDRDKALSRSSKTKYLATLKKVLVMASDDGLLTSIPTFPKIKAKQTARVTFTKEEYATLLLTAIQVGKDPKFPAIDKQMFHAIALASTSFLRPTRTELFGIKNRDVTIRDNPKCLEIQVNGKTGSRVTITMPSAADAYTKQLKFTGRTDPDDYVLFPEEEDRDKLRFKIIDRFNKILEVGRLKYDKDGNPRSMYSLRHFGIQRRLIGSGGKINIYSLARNAGTSVEMLESHYLKHMGIIDPDIIENLHYKYDKDT